jgi:hypothetical protein
MILGFLFLAHPTSTALDEGILISSFHFSASKLGSFVYYAAGESEQICFNNSRTRIAFHYNW